LELTIDAEKKRRKRPAIKGGSEKKTTVERRNWGGRKGSLKALTTRLLGGYSKRKGGTKRKNASDSRLRFSLTNSEGGRLEVRKICATGRERGSRA